MFRVFLTAEFNGCREARTGLWSDACFDSQVAFFEKLIRVLPGCFSSRAEVSLRANHTSENWVAHGFANKYTLIEGAGHVSVIVETVRAVVEGLRHLEITGI